jgi:hypothetical protein
MGTAACWMTGGVRVENSTSLTPGLPFLTAGLSTFVTRKARRTSAYKICLPNNITLIIPA